MIENDLRDTSTVWESGDEDWAMELRRFVEVKFYWISHGRRGRRALYPRIEESSPD